MKHSSEAGIGHLVVFALIALAVGVVVFAGYRVMQIQDTTATTAASSEQQAKIDTKPQLKQADQTLSEVSAQLNSDLDTSSLDTDIQALY